MNCHCHEITGVASHFVESYAHEHLEKIRADGQRGERIYQCPVTGLLWLWDRPYPSEQAGGPPRLRRVTENGDFVGRQNMPGERPRAFQDQVRKSLRVPSRSARGLRWLGGLTAIGKRGCQPAGRGTEACLCELAVAIHPCLAHHYADRHLGSVTTFESGESLFRCPETAIPWLGDRAEASSAGAHGEVQRLRRLTLDGDFYEYDPLPGERPSRNPGGSA